MSPQGSERSGRIGVLSTDWAANIAEVVIALSEWGDADDSGCLEASRDDDLANLGIDQLIS
jgi:hypothetical protein